MMRHGFSGAERMTISNPNGALHPLDFFPSLESGNHDVTSPRSRQYNCIAWAAEIDNKQIWPDGAEGIAAEPAIEWPEGIPNEETPESFVAYFQSLGYQLCDGPDFEAGFLKVAIFVKEGRPTHACRQLPCQRWTSKMGWDGVDIVHDDLECIEGDQYGKATIYVKRFA